MKKLASLVLLLAVLVGGLTGIGFANDSITLPDEEVAPNSTNGIIQYYIDGANVGTSGPGGSTTFYGPPSLWGRFIEIVTGWMDTFLDGVVSVFTTSIPGAPGIGRNARGCVQYYPHSSWVCPY